MASAQVLPNPAASSRRDLLQAGKKKLEEFRKKKAEGRAKKVASAGQLQSADVDQHEKFSQNTEYVGDGSRTVRNNSSIIKPSEMDMMDSPSTDIDFSNNTYADSPELFNGDIVGDASQGKPSKLYESSVVSEPVNGYYGHRRETNTGISAHTFNASDSVGTNPNIGGDGNHSRFQFGSQSGESTRSSKVYVRDYDSSDTHVMNTPPERSGTSVGMSTNIDEDVNRSRFQFGSQSGESKTSSEVNVRDHDSSDTYTMNALPERSGGAFAQNRLELPSTSTSIYGINGGTTVGVQQNIPGNMNHESVFGVRKNIDSTGRNINVASTPWHTSVPPTADLSLPDKSFSNQPPFPLNDPGTTSGRSRPSFLASLGLARDSSTSHAPYYDLPKANPPISVMNTNSMDVLSQPSTKQLFSEVNSSEQSHDLRTSDKEFSMNSLTSNDNQPSKLAFSDRLYENHDIQSRKKDEDFAALEQYIEDLTQEKFSLQRALETSKSLAESLAAENSSLTESYNQQGQVLNQFKSDLDRMQEEVKAQMLALESAKLEYTNAQLECNAADERAKILATEVISLEEKALRLRSNELKLEKQLATMNSEVTSYKSKISILEKVRQDLQSTVDAMVEEKKLLQSKIRKASGNINDSSKSSSAKRDASTSTEDLGSRHSNNFVGGETNIVGALQDVTPSLVLSGESSSFSSLPGDGSFSGVSSSIPSDQLKMIDNINSLTSELALEKEELIRALMIESSNSSKLKDLNKDLSQRLESQTQRLELLTAQRMANENGQAKPMEIQSMHDIPVYADEGDEVVERVLSWIMRLFPGGPSKRRTGKRL